MALYACPWLARVCGLSLQPIGCTSALTCDEQRCGAICLCLCLEDCIRDRQLKRRTAGQRSTCGNSSPVRRKAVGEQGRRLSPVAADRRVRLERGGRPVVDVGVPLEQLGDVRGPVRRRKVHRTAPGPRDAAGTQSFEHRLEVGARAGAAVADVAVGDDRLRQLDLQSLQAAELAARVHHRVGGRKYYLKTTIR